MLSKYINNGYNNSFFFIDLFIIMYYRYTTFKLR